MIDLDGTFAFSRVAGVEISSPLALKVYPNPVIDQLHIKSRNWGEIQQITLYNATGSPIYQSSDIPREQIDVSGLRPGTYVLSVKTLKGVSESRRIIIGK